MTEIYTLRTLDPEQFEDFTREQDERADEQARDLYADRFVSEGNPIEGFLIGAVIGALMWAAIVAVCWSVV